MWLLAYASQANEQWQNSAPLSHSRHKSPSRSERDVSKLLQLFSVIHQGPWRPTVCVPDATVPEKGAKLVVSMYVSDDEAQLHTRSFEKATAPNAQEKLRKSITRHDDEAWRATIRFTSARAPSAGAKLHENRKNREWHDRGKEVWMNSKTGLKFYWRIYYHALITASNTRTNLKTMRCLTTKTTTLTIRNAPHDRLHMSVMNFCLPLPYHQFWRRNIDRYASLRHSSLL